jgi:hypothetical protein
VIKFILLLLFLILVGGIGRTFSGIVEGLTSESNTEEWPVLARTAERNEAYMIKALLNDANIETMVEEDTTLGVLYGVQNITDYPIRVPENDRRTAQGILRESSFEQHLEEKI